MAAELPLNFPAWPTLWREEADTLAARIHHENQNEWTFREAQCIARAATRRKYRLERAAAAILESERVHVEGLAVEHAGRYLEIN